MRLRTSDDSRPRDADVDDVEFTIGLRGYDRRVVDELKWRAVTAVMGGPAERQAARAAIANTELPIALRGYDRMQVDAYLQRMSEMLAR